MLNAGAARAGQGAAIARNLWSRFPHVSCPGHRWQALEKGGRSVGSVATLRLGLAPLPVAAFPVDTSAPGWLPKKASLSPTTHRQPAGPFPLTGRQSRRSPPGVAPALPAAKRETAQKRPFAEASRHGRSLAGNVSVRDYEIRHGESGQGNRPEDQEIFHGQWVAHDQFERGEIPKGR